MRQVVSVLLAAGGLTLSARSDEGMWLLNDPPRQFLKEKYQFELTDVWLANAMQASVRFNNGGSGGFVSPHGLIVTNHHIAADSIQKLSGPGKDYHRNGFLARAEADELKCPDLELNVLREIVDVTDRVKAAVTADMDPARAAAARKAVMDAIESESLKATKLRSDVVTLYQGGLYHLYRYKKYTDVRLVFAPEHAIAFFGGDADNFEYPRFNLDVAFFRAYEDGQPVKVEQWFSWSPNGPKENDLSLVVGHPGTTNRLETLAKLTHRRDHTLPYTLNRLRSMEAALEQYAARGPEQRRQAANDLHRVANSRKAFSGQYQGLLDASIIAVKERQERALIDPVIENPRTPGSEKANPWRTIADAQVQYTEFEKAQALFDRGDAFASELFTIARHLTRLSAELPKQSANRLREYRDSNLDSLKFQLFSPAPIHPALERAKLAASLTFLAETLGGEHSLVVRVLDGQSPAARAEALVAGSKLQEVAERKRLFDGGKDAVESSQDPLVALARQIDEASRGLRTKYETIVEEPERQAYAEIAKIRFQRLGRSVAPDATFTLRLAFGAVKGYAVGGETLPFHTTFGGLYAKADAMGHRDACELPKRWLERKDKLDPATAFNFVSTADTIGGNSGSPVLNRAGELVGINFDRNRHGLVRNFVYTEVQARHIAVHSKAVLEVLDKLYDAPELVKELTAR